MENDNDSLLYVSRNSDYSLFLVFDTFVSLLHVFQAYENINSRGTQLANICVR